MKSFAVNSVLVSIATAFVHLANYIVIAAIAAFFGATWQTDAFFLAFSIPSFFVGAIVSAVGSVFIPVFAECKENRPDILDRLIGSALLYVLVITVAVALFMGAVAFFLSKGEDHNGISDQFLQLVINQTFLLLPVIVIQTLTGVLSAFYNTNSKFLYPPATDAISTLSVILIIVVLKSTFGIFSVPLGFLAGAIIHLGLLALFWKRFNIKIVWTWNLEPELHRSIGLSLPLIVGTAALQFGSVIMRFLAAQLGEGSVTILDYASRVSYGIMELLTSGVLLVILTKWSNHPFRRDFTWLASQVKDLTLMMAFVVVPLIGIGIALREHLVALAFERGNFDITITTATASLLFYFLLAIPIDAISRIYVRLFFVWQSTLIIGSLAAVRVIIATILAITLMRLIGLEGIALADTMAILIISITLILLVNRKLGNTLSGSGSSLIKTGISAVCASASAAWVGKLFGDVEFKALFAGGIAGCIIYLTVSWILGNTQLATLITLINPRLARRTS